jgi:hypothetical protein
MQSTAEPWTWWQGALGLAGVAALSLLWTRARLGVSGSIESVVDRPMAPGDVVSSGDRVGAWALLLGIVLGGYLASGASAGFAPEAAWVERFGGGSSAWAAALFGGVLVGFGTRFAGGCTSGHGLVGCALFSARSLVATGSFFGTAIAVTLALEAFGGLR